MAVTGNSEQKHCCYIESWRLLIEPCTEESWTCVNERQCQMYLLTTVHHYTCTPIQWFLWKANILWGPDMVFSLNILLQWQMVVWLQTWKHPLQRSIYRVRFFKKLQLQLGIVCSIEKLSVFRKSGIEGFHGWKF